MFWIPVPKVKIIAATFFIVHFLISYRKVTPFLFLKKSGFVGYFGLNTTKYKNRHRHFTIRTPKVRYLKSCSYAFWQQATGPKDF